MALPAYAEDKTTHQIVIPKPTRRPFAVLSQSWQEEASPTLCSWRGHSLAN
jgi:hypothetical protein